MAYALSSCDLPAARSAPARPLARLFKRLVNAMVASRIDEAERELRRHQAMIGETARLHGEHRRIGLCKADLLPFTL